MNNSLLSKKPRPELRARAYHNPIFILPWLKQNKLRNTVLCEINSWMKLIFWNLRLSDSTVQLPCFRENLLLLKCWYWYKRDRPIRPKLDGQIFMTRWPCHTFKFYQKTEYWTYVIYTLCIHAPTVGFGYLLCLYYTPCNTE